MFVNFFHGTPASELMAAHAIGNTTAHGLVLEAANSIGDESTAAS
ncbi:hypothetical protein [Aromatoleum evansii]|nr:hypothetical protein [Aromatoleum evansii]